MLLTNVAHRDLLPLAVGDRDTENAFAQEDTLGVVPQSAVAKVRKEGFRFVKPVVYRKIILGLAAKSPRAALCVLEWMCDNYTS